MGSEDLFHKKRERTANDLKRQKETRVAQPKILIVCEDSKSSAFYLEDLVKDLDLSGVRVRGKECGSAPTSVVNYAIVEYEKSKVSGDSYDRVYCVFDRDQHQSFDAALKKIANKKPKNKFFAITTTPCFEFWLLLYFSQNFKPYHTTQNKSPCDNANSDLKVHWSDYGKNKRDIYAFVKDKIDVAMVNAKQLVSDGLQTGSTNPQTNMHELIEYLQSIKR